MTADKLFDRVLCPFGPPTSDAFLHRDQSDNKYVFPEDVFGASELLSGCLISLPGRACLDGIDTTDPAALERELQKAWVGGYVSGREWAFVNIGMFLALLHEEPSGPLMQALAEYDWDETATQPELRAWFTDMAIFFRSKPAKHNDAKEDPTSAGAA